RQENRWTATRQQVLDLYGHFEGDAVESRVTARDGYRRILHDNQKDPNEERITLATIQPIKYLSIAVMSRQHSCSTLSDRHC
ncbi:hypothetical protein, partial [Herbaspirillum sp. RV1423]|uniref:hypothetical protein n=1 Tax=Herbaspirillum sp. RV1423 TaxID=1443993 RepID=UPI001E5FB873